MIARWDISGRHLRSRVGFLPTMPSIWGSFRNSCPFLKLKRPFSPRSRVKGQQNRFYHQFKRVVKSTWGETCTNENKMHVHLVSAGYEETASRTGSEEPPAFLRPVSKGIPILFKGCLKGFLSFFKSFLSCLSFLLRPFWRVPILCCSLFKGFLSFFEAFFKGSPILLFKPF